MKSIQRFECTGCEVTFETLIGPLEAPPCPKCRDHEYIIRTPSYTAPQAAESVSTGIQAMMREREAAVAYHRGITGADEGDGKELSGAITLSLPPSQLATLYERVRAELGIIQPFIK